MENPDLTDDEEMFLHGACHLFAVALHETTGLPLAAYLDTDDDVEGVVLCHAFVLDGDHAVDVRGRVPLEEVLKDFDSNYPWLADMTVEGLLQLGEGRESLCANDERMAVARGLAVAMAERMAALQLPVSLA